MTKKYWPLVASLTSLSAAAYVPPGYQQQGSGVLPSARPVHGPIRPNTADVVNQSSTDTRLTSIWPMRYESYLVQPLFWGAEWADPRFKRDKIIGIDRWFRGYPLSNYARVLDQYVGSRVQMDYHDPITVTDSDLGSGSQNQDVIPAFREICGLIDRNKLSFAPDGASFYPVYLAKRRPAGGACGVNVSFVCDRYPASSISFTLIYDLDDDPLCDPHDQETEHSQGLAAIANVTARAVADLKTDWDFNGLYDSSGNEVDDKCAWTFNVPYVTFTNGSRWKLQGLWSNYAYWFGTGYPNANGKKGCEDGQ